MMLKPKAIALVSGGLDSLISAKLIEREGVQVKCIFFYNNIIFNMEHRYKVEDILKENNLDFISYDNGDEFKKLVEFPTMGYGRGANPCIDCRILNLKIAKEIMLKNDFDFIITGEVVGQRPFSQRRDMILKIEKESGTEGIVVRPLSIRHFSETEPERRGIINRDNFFDITGRSRKIQLQLASRLKIKNFLSPAGGCYLTEREYANKVFDLLKYNQFSDKNLKFLNFSRHFRLNEKAKLILGKNRIENEKLERLFNKGMLMFEPCYVAGPTGLGLGEFSPALIRIAGEIIVSYTKADADEIVKVRYTSDNQTWNITEVKKKQRDEFRRFRI